MKGKTKNLALLDAFLDDALFHRTLSQQTIEAYRSDIDQFLLYLGNQSVCQLHVMLITNFLNQRHAKHYKAASQLRMCASLRQFAFFLKRRSMLTADVETLFQPIKVKKYLPSVLSEKQVDALLCACDLSKPLGIRDQLMIELMYGSGLRVSELTNLSVHQMNVKQGAVKVMGKGNKERLVPMNESCIKVFKHYLKNSRSVLLSGVSSEKLLVSQKSTAMSRQSVWYRIKKIAQKAQVDTPVSPHTLRHAFATHLLNHGADLRVLQLLLGHVNINTTEIYTHISSYRMQMAYQKHHPRG